MPLVLLDYDDRFVVKLSEDTWNTSVADGRLWVCAPAVGAAAAAAAAAVRSGQAFLCCVAQQLRLGCQLRASWAGAATGGGVWLGAGGAELTATHLGVECAALGARKKNDCSHILIAHRW